MKRRDFLAGLSGMVTLPVLTVDPALAQVSRADLTRITNALNAIGSMMGTFVQVGPDGDLSEGTFYMRRPGRVRFEYNPPNPTLIIADGFWVAVYDTVDGSFDRFPLSETPLDLLLRDRVNLREEKAIQSVERSSGQLRVNDVGVSLTVGDLLKQNNVPLDDLRITFDPNMLESGKVRFC